MKLKNKNMYNEILILSLVFTSLTIFSLSNSSYRTSNTTASFFELENAQTGSNPSFIICEQVENNSIAWLEGSIQFNITTDVDLTVYYTVYGVGDDNLKLRNILRSKQVTPGSTIITIPIEINPTTLPGVYSFDMTLSFYNSSTGLPIQQTIKQVSGDLTVTMGYLLLIIFVGVLMTGLIIIIIREEKLRPQKEKEAETSSVYVPDQEEDVPEAPSYEGVKDGYIKCPECKEEIIEGSSFCPECGYHIPRFLRTRQQGHV